ncbi:MAG: glycoside hydrolase family 5 protein [Mediterranea sp.]|jgi:endoglucanase|nr:glycoside hydrolase family 5 protein [Mediterranea sp.]
MIKKLYDWFYLLPLALLWVGCNVTPTSSVERLKVEGTRLVNGQGKTVVLRGVSFGWNNWHPRFYSAGAVKELVDVWGCNVVRASMGVGPEGSYLDNPLQGINCVTAVVDAAIANDVYAIIDWHSHEIHTAEAKAFFTKMAERYRDIPNVIYEIFNEPVYDSWDDVKQYAVEVIEAIRAVDSQALILVGCPHWDQDVHIAADSPLTGYSNLMYTLHFYAGTHHSELRDRGDYALSKGLPLFVSECGGMEASGDGPLDYDDWQAWQTWMNRHSISWVAWSLSDKDETCSMLRPSASSVGKWKDDDIKEWGELVRKSLSHK